MQDLEWNAGYYDIRPISRYTIRWFVSATMYDSCSCSKWLRWKHGNIGTLYRYIRRSEVYAAPKLPCLPVKLFCSLYGRLLSIELRIVEINAILYSWSLLVLQKSLKPPQQGGTYNWRAELNYDGESDGNVPCAEKFWLPFREQLKNNVPVCTQGFIRSDV